MSCNSKDCGCHQNSSFIFGLIIGLVIAAVVAIVIYKNSREEVIIKLKKQIEKFISAISRSASGGKPKSEEIIKSFIAPDIPRKKVLKKKKKVSPIKVTEPEPHKKEVVIPKNLIIATATPSTSVPKPKKMFKKYPIT